MERTDLADSLVSVSPGRTNREETSRTPSGSFAADAGPKDGVSLVIPVRDEAPTIEQLIASINRQTRQPNEVIFVDGGSRDGTIDLLRRACQLNPAFRLVEARKALPGQGRNIGVANAYYDWIAFTDAGNRLEPNWLEELIRAAQSDPDTGIVCGNFEPITDSFFTRCASIAYVPNKIRRADCTVRGPFIASSLARRDVWHAAGGFPDLRAAEDLIFFEEVESKGYKFQWAPKATVHWELRPGLWSTFRRFQLYSRINVWAGRQKQWHYGVARFYALALPFLVLAVWKSPWWLLVPIAGLVARVARRIWMHREEHGFFWTLNPLRILYVLAITLTLDCATFTGWAQAIVNRKEAMRVRNHLRTRRGD